jgi:hypothetical protein
MSNSTFTVIKIDDQKDRVLLYKSSDYYAIASSEKSKDVKIGDLIEYEPCGCNFGWFVSKL